jgi:hypothetical protein
VRNTTLSDDVAWNWRVDFERLKSGELEAEYWACAPRISALVVGLLSGRLRPERRCSADFHRSRADCWSGSPCPFPRDLRRHGHMQPDTLDN